MYYVRKQNMNNNLQEHKKTGQYKLTVFVFFWCTYKKVSVQK